MKIKRFSHDASDIAGAVCGSQLIIACDDQWLEDLIKAYQYYYIWLKGYAGNCFAGIRGKSDCDKIEDGEALLDEIERRLELLNDNGPNEEALQGNLQK